MKQFGCSAALTNAKRRVLAYGHADTGSSRTKEHHLAGCWTAGAKRAGVGSLYDRAIISKLNHRI